MSDPNAIYNPGNQYGLPPKIAQTAYKSFTDYDINRNGSITADEMKQCLELAKVEYQDADVDQMLNKYMDLNKDGTVSLDEYMKFMAAIYRGECDGFKLPNIDIKH